MNDDGKIMRAALQLARRGYGTTSPNPMVGAILVNGGKVIGRGWHRRAGEPHGEIEAIRDALKRGNSPKGATLYVTLEPCSTQGRTPPCTKAIIEAGIKGVVIGARDPNPKHCGKGFGILKRAGIGVAHGVLAAECTEINETFNHWIVHGTPFVTVKAAMTLDGKIATASGESKWITGENAREYGMKLRKGADAILVGVNTILADNPSLTVRERKSERRSQKSEVRSQKENRLRRIVLDSRARTPLSSKVVTDEFAELTTILVGKSAPKNRVGMLAERVNVIRAPFQRGSDKLDLRWLLRKLGGEGVASLLVEGGGEVNASFLMGGFAQRIAFFYAPKILGGRDSRMAVAGRGPKTLKEVRGLKDLQMQWLGQDLLLTARVKS